MCPPLRQATNPCVAVRSSDPERRQWIKKKKSFNQRRLRGFKPSQAWGKERHEPLMQWVQSLCYWKVGGDFHSALVCLLLSTFASWRGSSRKESVSAVPKRSCFWLLLKWCKRQFWVELGLSAAWDKAAACRVLVFGQTLTREWWKHQAAWGSWSGEGFAPFPCVTA